MTILRPELLEPGYIFLAPYRNIAPGPYIYDNFGELVWSGAGSAGPRTAHMPHVCQYKGEDHLCFFQGDQYHGFARGFGVIMDNTYRMVKTIESAGAGASSDMHEFRLTPHSNGKTALVTVYQPRAYDLTVNPRFNLERGLGWVNDGIFQEIDIETGRLLFEWRSLDHVDPQDSWVMPSTTDTSGSGLDIFTAWDYFHINSVDKNKAGDFLISARHASAIYKLSGQDGRVLWKLGGARPTIQCVDFNFGYQHEARWVSENDTHTVLSFFDNSGNSYNHTSEWSRALIVSIDHVSNMAFVIKSWSAPDPRGGLKSGSQGSLQLLPNGGAHIAWGEHAYISEHLEDGSAVMYGRLALRTSNVMIYRSYKFLWKGFPRTNPTMWTFSKSGDEVSGTRFFISWNGATEVASWRFFAASSASGPFNLAASTAKRGFETEFHLPAFTAWSYAEALDIAGSVLGKSPMVKTFVPSVGLANYCDERGCQNNEGVSPNRSTPHYASFETVPEFLSVNRGYDTARYYPDTGVAHSRGNRASWQPSSLGFFSSGFWLLVCAVLTAFAVWVLRRGRASQFSRVLLDALLALPKLVLSICLSNANRKGMPHEKEEWELMSTSSSSARS